MNKKIGLIVVIAALGVVGCSGQNNGDLLSPAMSGLDGTWEYLITNAHDARFSGCSGDAAVLEGATLFEGLSLAPICMTPVTFDVNQAGQTFDAETNQVTCSDGATAQIAGFGQIDDPVIGGQWESLSDGGVESIQSFTGVIAGNTIQISELRRDFTGNFEGGCDLSPPVEAIITVQ